MKKFILTSVLLLTTCSSAFSMSDSNSTWDVFKKHNTIIGFTLGKNTIEDIVNKMGAYPPSKPENKHELATLCLEIKNESNYIVFSTGVLHDYSTLYGFQISKNIQDNSVKNCKSYNLKNNEKLSTVGGLHIGMLEKDVLKLLNSPTEKSVDAWTWEYENYKKYEKQKISMSEAGPTDSKYIMKFISNGLYEGGSISVKFSADKAVDISISYYAESDFEIEHYDIKTGERIR